MKQCNWVMNYMHRKNMSGYLNFSVLFNKQIIVLIFSKVPAFLHVVDIAGLVEGAHEGKVRIYNLFYKRTSKLLWSSPQDQE